MNRTPTPCDISMDFSKGVVRGGATLVGLPSFIIGSEEQELVLKFPK